MATDAVLILDDDEFDPRHPRGVPGFARTISFAESDVDEDLEWIGGLRRIDTVYVEHPVRSSLMMPLASFHRLVFEDKACEAIQLAANLGARRIEAEHLTGWGREMAATFGLPRLNADVRRTQSESTRLLFAADYKPHFKPPAKDETWEDWSEDLADAFPWLRHERTWQPMAAGRFDGTLHNFSLLVTYENDDDINADLVAGLKKVGLSAGGNFMEFKRTSWRFDVAF